MSTELSPGSKYTLPNSNISITAVGLTSPPLQVHSSTFISDKRVEKVFKKDAEDFNCQFDQSLCKFEGFATEVNCQCRNLKMKDYKKKNLLPMKGIHHEVRIINNHIATVAVQDTLVALQVEIRNSTISRMTTVQKCEARQQGDLIGCQSCFEGGSVSIQCSAKKPMKALLHCRVFDTILQCDPFGPVRTHQPNQDRP
ncbi:hypothetical protein L3Y34_014248 [Caenorhabditis briggsae]|uniref:Phlebovirus glycoprotein G2 fusion domain-containing protein n=1 Tax=Caenorhabditis briggsae TaxID=6238 RepID=A0AAE9DRL1_CAEBR|nr:hypothetical protein L3Y34_014248 [Caenorhabditis briggsae]